MSVDNDSLVLDVLPGTFGDVLEHELRNTYNVTCGHWPQSIALSTVGGWLACRGAGQLSTRYGKIEDLVIGLDVALADGSVITTGGQARQAVGPDLNQLFVGSEGTLGIITGARLRLFPAPVHENRSAFGFSSFEAGIDACRRVMRRGATPAVLRLYDPIESSRNYGTTDTSVLLVMDEGDRADGHGHDDGGPRRVRLRRPARRRARRAVAGPPQRRVRPRDADPGRPRGRHDGDHRAVAHPPTSSTAKPSPRSPPCGHSRRVGPPVAQLHGRRLPLLHLRRQPRGAGQGRLLPGSVGRRHPGGPGRRRCPQPPPRRRAQPRPVRAPRPWATASTCSPPSRPPSTPRASSTPASSASPTPFGPVGFG